MTKKEIGKILGLSDDVLVWTTSDWNKVFEYKRIHDETL